MKKVEGLSHASPGTPAGREEVNQDTLFPQLTLQQVGGLQSTFQIKKENRRMRYRLEHEFNDKHHIFHLYICDGHSREVSKPPWCSFTFNRGMEMHQASVAIGCLDEQMHIAWQPLMTLLSMVDADLDFGDDDAATDELEELLSGQNDLGK